MPAIRKWQRRDIGRNPKGYAHSKGFQSGKELRQHGPSKVLSDKLRLTGTANRASSIGGVSEIAFAGDSGSELMCTICSALLGSIPSTGFSK